MRRLLLMIFLICGSVLFAQSAADIIHKNIERSGGLTQWRLLNSIELTGKVILGVNEDYPVKIFQQRPNLKKTVFNIKGKDYVVDGYDGKNGYSMNFQDNKLSKVPNYEPESFDTDFIDYQNKGFKATYLGEQKVGNRQCFMVELTKNVNKTVYFFDTTDYELVKEVGKDGVLQYANYQKVGKLMMPFKIQSSGGKEGDYVLVFSKIEINKALPKSTFKF